MTDSPLLPPALLPSAAYYARIGAAGGRARIALQAPYDKRRKETHRYRVADSRRGAFDLTVPVHPPHGIPQARWTDVAVSDHGRWQAVHAAALATAYGPSPFFEHYMPRLAPLLLPPGGTPLARHIEALNAAVCAILLIDNHIDYSADAVVPMPEPGPEPPYWQPHAGAQGFTPGLSVLDLIFNLGPEAALAIRSFPIPNSSFHIPIS